MGYTHKRYFLDYESDKISCGSNNHTWGNANSVKTCKQYIARARKEISDQNPRNFRIYDCEGDLVDGFVPCIYQED